MRACRCRHCLSSSGHGEEGISAGSTSGQGREQRTHLREQQGARFYGQRGAAARQWPEVALPRPPGQKSMGPPTPTCSQAPVLRIRNGHYLVGRGSTEIRGRKKIRKK